MESFFNKKDEGLQKSCKFATAFPEGDLSCFDV